MSTWHKSTNNCHVISRINVNVIFNWETGDVILSYIIPYFIYYTFQLYYSRHTYSY